MPDLIKTTVGSIVEEFALDCDVDYVRVCSAVVNDSMATGVIDQAAHLIVGKENMYKPPQSLGAEDFSWYPQDVPGAIFRLGVRGPGSTGSRDAGSHVRPNRMNGLSFATIKGTGYEWMQTVPTCYETKLTSTKWLARRVTLGGW